MLCDKLNLSDGGDRGVQWPAAGPDQPARPGRSTKPPRGKLVAWIGLVAAVLGILGYFGIGSALVHLGPPVTTTGPPAIPSPTGSNAPTGRDIFIDTMDSNQPPKPVGRGEYLLGSTAFHDSVFWLGNFAPTYRLPGGMQTFSATLAVSHGSVEFIISVDGRGRLLDRRVFSQGGPVQVNCDIRGGPNLNLSTQADDPSDMSVWGGAKLSPNPPTSPNHCVTSTS